MFDFEIFKELASGLVPVGMGFIFGFCVTYLITKNIKHDHH